LEGIAFYGRDGALLCSGGLEEHLTGETGALPYKKLLAKV